MTLAGNLLLWGSVIWLPALEYFLLRNEAKPKKNIVVGVTLPQQGWQQPAVQAELAGYRRALGLVCLGLTLAALPPILLCRRMGLGLILYCVWIDLCVVLPQAPFVRCNRRLRAYKAAQGWAPAPAQRTAELAVAAQPVRWLPLWSFLLPLALALLPLAADWGPLAPVYGCGAAAVALCWACYRWLYRNRAEAVDENTLRTEALTRMRRANWGRCWLWCAWAMAALNLCIWLLQGHFWAMMAATLGVSCAMTAAVVGVEFRTRRMQEMLTADCDGPLCVDEDDKWLWGLFYYDPHDARLVVNSRTGINGSFNLARPAAKVITGACAVLLLALPLLGVWIDREERSPVTLTLAGDALEAGHAGTAYRIPLEEVETAELLDTLPAMNRVWGTGMGTVQKGSYISSLGSLTVCVDPRAGPWLLVTTRDGTRYLLGGRETDMAALYAEVEPWA